jgi:hypothetical protein
MILMRANQFRGPLEGRGGPWNGTSEASDIWAQKLTFLCPSIPPFQWPSKWICPHQNTYVTSHINNRCINYSYLEYIQRFQTVETDLLWPYVNAIKGPVKTVNIQNCSTPFPDDMSANLYVQIERRKAKRKGLRKLIIRKKQGFLSLFLFYTKKSTSQVNADDSV